MIMAKLPTRLLLFIKLFSGAIIYFLVRLSYIEQEESYFDLDSTSVFYLIYTTGLVFLVWQINDWCYKYFYKKLKNNLFQTKNIFKYQFTVISIALLSLTVAMYILHFHIAELLGCEWTTTPLSLMKDDLSKSLVITLVFNLIYLTIVFISYKRDADLNEEKIKKENLLFKYESLRNQIDPHFLFNSFSVLNTLIQTDQNTATEFLNNLSDLYRYVLLNKDKNLTSIHKELECLNSYLYLMKIRHEDCIESEINIPEKVLSRHIPTMSLQMLVENAIKHNSFNEKHPLKISLSYSNDYLTIANKLNVRKTNKISAGIGLKNIEKRYELYTDQKVTIDKTDTHFIVKIPLLK